MVRHFAVFALLAVALPAYAGEPKLPSFIRPYPGGEVTLEGKVTQITQHMPEGRSTLEV